MKSKSKLIAWSSNNNCREEDFIGLVNFIRWLHKKRFNHRNPTLAHQTQVQLEIEKI